VFTPRFASQVVLDTADRQHGLAEADQPGPGLPRAVVFRDSFAGAMVPFLSEAFGHVRFVYDHQPDPRLIEVEKPDVVILEMVERYVARSVDLTPPVEMLRRYPASFYAPPAR
jgi:hypothetical protein